MVNARKNTGLPYTTGGLFEQPYFMIAYVEPWLEQAYQERDQFKGLGGKITTEMSFIDQVVALNLNSIG